MILCNSLQIKTVKLKANVTKILNWCTQKEQIPQTKAIIGLMKNSFTFE